MKKSFLVLFLVLSLTFVVWAENSEKQTTIQKNNFRIKPNLFYSVFSTVVIRSNWKCGLTLVGVDVVGAEYKNWNFFGIGGGVAANLKNSNKIYYDYYYGQWRKQVYDVVLWPYLKIVPVKYRWDWLSKQLGVKTHFEISFTTRKELVIGFTFSDSLKKKRPRRGK